MSKPDLSRPWEFTTYNGTGFNELFPRQTIGDLMKLMGAESSNPMALHDLKRGLHDVASAFTCAIAAQSEHGNRKEVYRAIAKVGKNAERLLESILELQETSNGGQILLDKITQLDKAEERGIPLWSDARAENPFYYFLRVLADVMEGAERGQDLEIDTESFMEFILSGASPDELDEAFVKGTYLRRVPGEEFTAPENPVTVAVARFEPTWRALSHLPYTEGTYFKEVGRYSSNAVEALMLILARLDHKTPASTIGTELRNLRASKQHEKQD